MKIYTITGCGASGKDSLLNKLINKVKCLTPIISTTSRPMREGEIEGVAYKFVSGEKAKQMLNNNEFLEHRIYTVADKSEWIYGITKDSIDVESNNNYIVIVDFEGLKTLESYLVANGKQNSLVSIYIDVSKQNRLLRYLQREKMNEIQTDEAIRRYLDDNNNVLPAIEYCDYIVNNDGNINIALNRILDIIEEN